MGYETSLGMGMAQNQGGTTGGGGMGGGMWGMIASYAMAELDREKQDRAALFQGLAGAQDDNTWIMQHYPDFYSTPQVHTQSVANANPNAPSTSGYQASQALSQGLNNQAAMNRQNASQEFEKWKMDREDERTQKYMDWIERNQGFQGSQDGWNRTSSGIGYKVI